MRCVSSTARLSTRSLPGMPLWPRTCSNRTRESMSGSMRRIEVEILLALPRRVSQLMTPRLSVRTTMRHAGIVTDARTNAAAAPRAPPSTPRDCWSSRAHRPRPPRCSPSGHSIRYAHAPAPGFPEHAPSVYATTVAVTARGSGRSSRTASARCPCAPRGVPRSRPACGTRAQNSPASRSPQGGGARDARVEREVAGVRVGAQGITFRVEDSRSAVRSQGARAAAPSRRARCASRAATSFDIERSASGRCASTCSMRSSASSSARGQLAAHRLELALHLDELCGVAHRASVEPPVQLADATLQRRRLELREPGGGAEGTMLLVCGSLRLAQPVELGVAPQRRLDAGDVRRERRDRSSTAAG